MGPVATISILLPLTFGMHAGARDPDAFRRLLWRPVWRRDLLDSVEPAVSSASRRDLSGRLSADQAGQGRNGAGHHHHRGLHRRLVRHHRNDLSGAVPGQDGARIRSCRGMFTDAGGIARRIDAGQGLAAQGHRDDRSRPPDRHRRIRHRDRTAALYLWYYRIVRRRRDHRTGARHVRHRRVHEQHQQYRRRRHEICQGRNLRHVSVEGRPQAGVLADDPRYLYRQSVRADPGHRSDDRFLCVLRHREENFEDARAFRSRRDRGRRLPRGLDAFLGAGRLHPDHEVSAFPATP